MRLPNRLALVAACVAVAGSGSVGNAGTAREPSLRLVSMKPLIVRGRSFVAGERVRLSLVSSTRMLRRTRASSSGTFTASFGTVTFGPCGGFTIRATGSGGSVAVLKRPPLPGCVPE